MNVILKMNVISNLDCPYLFSLGKSAFSDQRLKTRKDFAAVWGNNLVPCISPGFDGKEMIPARKIATCSEALNFIDNCNIGKRNMSILRIALMNFLNNFRFETNVEPGVLYRISGYRKMTV